MSRALVPLARQLIGDKPFRLTLEKMPLNVVRTGTIDVAGRDFTSWYHHDQTDAAIEVLAQELARHLGINRSDVDINQDPSVPGRRFFLVAHYLGKSPETTDGLEAWKHWTASGKRAQPTIPDYIDV